ncbi:hypothetical protein ASZ78_005202 [Callipepla squamata]|uniref:RRM domain-containing protein n=1 Tax=Callipepla squamata TaxID=9009 RepID=A0A226N8C9_CALSU|nr:hypothetical protein ASZ78_005202 [Callipepla squamata]
MDGLVTDVSAVGFKAGPDSLSSVSGKSLTMSNSTQAKGDENGKKKFKGMRFPCSPSRVLHLRQIPDDATEADVISLGLPFGRVTNVLILRGRSQSTQAALQAMNAEQSGNLAITNASAAEGGLSPGHSSVLRIIVENLFYPVTLEVLYQIFSKFGFVLKIVTFTRNNQFQALIQYAEPVNAYYAKMALDGRNIYNACCTLRIDFSKLTSLKVKYNNEKSRDFTRLDLPATDGQLLLDPAIVAAFGAYGDVLRVKIMFKNKENALVQMADSTQAQLAITNLNGQKIYGKFIRTTLSKHHNIQLPREGEDSSLTKDYSNSPLHRFKNPCSKNFQNIFPPSATLHLSNIPPTVSFDDLKSLFARTGSTVKALKFFQKDCKMALIQLGSVEEAVHALIELHNYDLGENHHLRVSFSKSTI